MLVVNTFAYSFHPVWNPRCSPHIVGGQHGASFFVFVFVVDSRVVI